jgi:pyruvate-ferredoxin/flavodoxin oxidoreductase
VDVVLSPDGNVFRHSNPLAGLAEGGVFVIQSDQAPAALWTSLPSVARRAIVQRKIRVFALDGFGIAGEEASDAELRYRMQGAAFMGAFFRASPLMQREALDEARLFDGIRAQVQQKFGKLGERVVEDNVRVIRRGFAEVVEVPIGDLAGDDAVAAPAADIPAMLDVPAAADGIANPGRFWEQVCGLNAVGQDIIADPFAAVSAIPAASSTIRDMTVIRFEVPDFIAEKCTGCAQCWTQCPDSAIPGLVNSVEDVIDTAIRFASNGRSLDRMRQISKHLARESRKILAGVPFRDFATVFSAAYANVVPKLGWEPDRRAALDAEFAAVHPVIADLPLAKTAPFFDVPERKEKGSGGLLSIMVNPEACKGCNICVDVCPEHALVTIKQDDAVVEKLRRNWALWQELPDTADRYINIASLEEGIGVLPSLLLRKRSYQSMVGGDGACMGCGEKTTVHLVTATVEALVRPRVTTFVAKLDGLIARLDAKARALISADADVDLAALADGGRIDVPVSEENKVELARLAWSLKALRDLRWRYVEGPGGRGRASLGITNSTGCSSVWGSTYPYNPYPFPWVNHLFQDSPSVAIGIFEGHMRKMADGFIAVRRAEKLLDGSYEETKDEAEFVAFDWRQFSDDEFALCPPILAIGGDGAMLDIGFQNLSRLLASGKPIRVLVLDTQVYSNTGGQACTSGFTGQVADMAAYGKVQHGKEEVRKELALIALAHRGTFVHQTSQASASHLIAGVLRGLQSRRPAVFNIYTPCPVEHGLPDEWAPHAAKLALESRAFPYMTYDPDAGDTFADCLSLDGNPALEDDWPSYDLEYLDADGAPAKLTLPLTIADWAATEVRFKKHFKAVPAEQWNEDMVPFHEYIDLPADERAGKVAFIHALGKDRHLTRLRVSPEMGTLAKDRLLYWSQLRQLAGVKVADTVRDRIAAELDAEFDRRVDALRQDYETRISQLRATYPAVVARRLAEGLLRAGTGSRTVADLLAEAEQLPGVPAVPADLKATATATATRTPAAPLPAAPAPVQNGAAPTAATATAIAAAPASDADEALTMDPYIESERCTTCNECTNLNGRMFAYNENKQAYIKNPKAGTFAQLVQAAERCPAAIIHPGTPLNPNEKDLEKWVKRAEPFN